MSFRCVPFNPEWVTNNKLDIKAIYRRPVRDPNDPFRRQVVIDGRPQWDLTGALPVLRHADWLREGMEYLTLADIDSLRKVRGWLISQGLEAKEFQQNPHTLGPWRAESYLQSVADEEAGHDEVEMSDAQAQQMAERYESEVRAKRRPGRPKKIQGVRDTPRAGAA